MQTTFQIARTLAKKHFHVFPIAENAKWPPIITGFPERATTDEAQIKKWWVDPVLDLEQGYNIGISTTHFNGSEALIVVDVDNKDGKDGSSKMLELELEGFLFPSTYTQHTPTGGMHLVYKAKAAVRQGVSVLGSGLDIRSQGGYIAAAGSTINGQPYLANDLAVADAPAWLIERCGAPRAKKCASVAAAVDEEKATPRAIFYLENEAPLSIKGAGGDQTAYRVAAHLKDMGLSSAKALELMLDHWNDRCPPGWHPERLREKVEHAYTYGINVPGEIAPEAQFTPIEEKSKALETAEKLHPFKELNKEFAFVMSGSTHHILWETKDGDGKDVLRHVAEPSFHAKFASKKMLAGDKERPLTKLWMESPERRSYDGFCFRPGQDTPKGFYNLFRGFAVNPHPKGVTPHPRAKKALDDWLGHIKENICDRNEAHFRWVVGYFAHIIQRPWEKPHTALVIRGKKGTGKNAVVDRIEDLLGIHYQETADKRYLVGQFNGHLENKLAITLNEAFWSGDRQADAMLKHLITGNTHSIEHKGQEAFVVPNLTRVLILGNEDWVVPAGADERRYAVFNVGEKRIQDGKFFGAIKEGMKGYGGNSLLLRYFRDFDLEGIDVNTAPQTTALLEQKHASLIPFEQWWLDCLTEGRLTGSDAAQDWPFEIERSRYREAVLRYYTDHKIGSRMLSDRAIGRRLKVFLPSVGTVRNRVNKDRVWCYQLPTLEQARKDWEKYIGHAIDWTELGADDGEGKVLLS